jgi:hypothetical protein
MSRNDPLFQKISTEQQDCSSVPAFTDSFSIDWFSGLEDMPPSKLLSTIRFLESQQWIAEQDGQPGIYGWTRKFPGKSWHPVTPSLWHQYCRSAADMLPAEPARNRRKPPPDGQALHSGRPPE